MTNQANLQQRLNDIHETVAATAQEAGRAASSVELCAVSKTFPAEPIREAIAAGQKIFGENRVQEAEAKWPDIQADNEGLELHLIGPLQTNKVKKAVALFDVIQTLDRPKLARALAAEMSATGRHLPCYIQVNTGNEAQKAGITPDAAGDFISACRNEHGLQIAGLMCIPPHHEEPSPHFALLHDLAARHDLEGLSMGMSADYRIAIEFGATIVRVGSAIFGARSPASQAAE